MTDPLVAFTAHRSLLFTVAYEILGVATDAEDVVQETWIRWADASRDDVRDERAYLVRIAARQAMNRLRALRRLREDYVGPWLPEPILTAPDVADDVALSESVSMAMLVVLETLGPVERAVFVLREVFAFEHGEIAEIVDRSPAAVRQIAHRAREHVQARRPRVEVAADEASAAVERFRAAAATGDVASLMAVLAPDVSFVSDGGGKVTAAVRPVVGADRVARFVAGLIAQHPDARIVADTVNGRPGFRAMRGDQVDGVGSIEASGGLITQISYVRNPDKLTRAAERTPLGR